MSLLDFDHDDYFDELEARKLRRRFYRDIITSTLLYITAVAAGVLTGYYLVPLP
jgi:hypothetical protein